jgi:OmpA-OmpF porin, OOP family
VRARELVAVSVAAIAATAIVRPFAARAEPALEASGFVGIDWFGAHTSLGESFAPEQVPGTAPVVGARLGWLAVPALTGDLALALEAELAFAPAFTGSNAAGGRAMYFAPVFEWRGQAVLRFPRWHAITPHLLVGGGGDTVTSSSPFMATDTSPILYWGPGLSVALRDDWQVRLELHHGVMPARSGGSMSTAELEFGIGTTFGAPPHRPREPAPPGPPASPVRGDPDRDSDGDGVPDRIDACPDQPGSAGADGCPVADPDGDGIVGDADHCPDQPEDKDGFQDADGCPDPDNDGDGILDAQDACPNEPETFNGYQDADGCPDTVPADIVAALATAVRFEPGHARITPAARLALRRVLAMLHKHPEVRIVIVGHAERAGGDDLAQHRAEAVKWHLIDQGLTEDRVASRVGAVPGAPAITFQLAR